MFVITCSGAFRNNGEMVDFSDLKLLMPNCADEWIQSNAMNRCFDRQAEKKLKKRVDSLHSLYIDEVDKESNKEKPSCCGKKIKALNWDELQDFAMMFCLRGVPLYRSCDLRTARAKSYQEYCDKILNQKTSENFNFADAPDFTVPDVAVKVAEHKGNAREVIDGTAKIGTEKV